MNFPEHIDNDLKRVWEYHPVGIPGKKREGGIDAYDYKGYYGSPPWRFRPVQQSGSRIRLRLLRSDGSDVKDGNNFIERIAYTSDLRRGVYWSVWDFDLVWREGVNENGQG